MLFIHMEGRHSDPSYEYDLATQYKTSLNLLTSATGSACPVMYANLSPTPGKSFYAIKHRPHINNLI